ncbi:hypothetical protein B9Z55_005571 [Caenorhabditis nigoni]|uniref:Uncharacterized protein n=1 Tax=Caenorhabditis nigoni TaxID=1611254 RepID=A0A2G5V1E9_9PELO|nr:hypothetical protein B9Z55_005571 [Caenorhabditis nigoni]
MYIWFGPTQYGPNAKKCEKMRFHHVGEYMAPKFRPKSTLSNFDEICTGCSIFDGYYSGKVSIFDLIIFVHF